MKSLKSCIKELSQNEWDYYSEINDKELKNPFTSYLSHNRFLEKFFYRSGKNGLLEIINYLPNKKLDNNRIKHTNSIFFLGVLLYTKTNLSNSFFDEENPAEYKRFPFLWFLTCLFHDFGFTYEKDNSSTNGINKISDLINRFNISNNILNTNPSQINRTLFSNIENYFNYRLNVDKVIDHGIFAGFFLYDRLVKIREKKIREFDNEYFWGSILIEQYAQVSIAIATHNIWIPPEEKFEIYTKSGLSDLTSFTALKFSDFHLLYLLGIVDTIDPIKMFLRDEHKPDYILRNICFNFENNIIEIKNKENSNLNFQRMIDAVKGLENWLDISISINNSDYIKILIR